MSKPFTMADFPSPEEQRQSWKTLRDSERSEKDAEAFRASQALERLRAEGLREQAQQRRVEVECLVEAAVGSSGCNWSDVQKEFMVQLVLELKQAWSPISDIQQEWRGNPKPRGR